MEKGRKKILVHTCCGACASPVFSQLQKDGFVPVAFFYNLGIDQKGEYEKRLQGVRQCCDENGIALVETAFDPAEFHASIEPFKDPASVKFISDKDRYQRRRCAICNTAVIQKTIEQAKKLRIKYFTSTLLCSPYKDHDEIIELSNDKSLDYNVNFYYRDFRKGYFVGRNYARNHGMIIASYCGCVESEKERRLE